MSRIVILGGMGPQASLELHRRIITAAAKAGSVNNQDYPEILHASIPIIDFISSGDSTLGLMELFQSLDKLMFQSDDQIVIACNTAHLLIKEIEQRYGVKVSSLINGVVIRVSQDRPSTLGLIASPKTIKSELYTVALAKLGYSLLLPNKSEVQLLEYSIRHIIANNEANKVKKKTEIIVQRMMNQGADKIILGCTELSIIFNDNDKSAFIDPLDEVVKQLIKV